MTEQQTKAILVVAALFFAIPCGLMTWLYLVDTARQAHIRDDGGCPHSLQAIGAALLRYHDEHGKLPPAVVRDAIGRRLFSWRVLLLPYLGEGALYNQFHLDEPWDSPHNHRLLAKIPWCFHPQGRDRVELWHDDFAPARPPSADTPYHVPVGPGTAFERDSLTWADFPDGRATTILVVEARRLVPWTKPDDSLYTPGQPLPDLGLADSRRWGFSVCFADGTARCFRRSTPGEAIHAMITRNGGETIDWSKLD
jgi:Protein of unknown function (DUF1559)